MQVSILFCVHRIGTCILGSGINYCSACSLQICTWVDQHYASTNIMVYHDKGTCICSVTYRCTAKSPCFPSFLHASLPCRATSTEPQTLNQLASLAIVITIIATEKLSNMNTLPMSKRRHEAFHHELGITHNWIAFECRELRVAHNTM